MNKKVGTIILIVALVVALTWVVASITDKAVTNYQCNDKIDNDGDGRCDFGMGAKCNDGSIPRDSGCLSKQDNSEATCVSGSSTCGVGACQRSSTCVSDQVSCTPGNPSVETCNNLDDDCDGNTDESLNQQCGVSNIGACKFGTQTCSAGAWGSCVGSINPVNETCDGLDNDCDGSIDEGITCSNPDSCADSDGGLVYNIAGNTSGYKNNAYYVQIDFCAGNTTLIENYCTGVNAYNTTKDCLGNGTSFCNTGRCW